MTIKALLRTAFAIITLIAVILLLVVLNLRTSLDSSFDSSSFRYQSSHLAKLSATNSTNLTINARQYVATLDSQYLDKYNHIVDQITGKAPALDGRSMAYLDRLKEINVPGDLLRYLEQSNDYSIALIGTEEAAFALIKPFAGKEIEDLTQQEQQDWMNAIHMLHDDAYEREVAKIMAPVNTFIERLDELSTQQLLEVQSSVARQSVLSIAAVFIIVALLVMCYFWLEKRVINVTIELVAKAQRIAAGDLTQRINTQSQDELAQLGNAFDEMVEKLASLLRNIQAQSRAAADAATQLNGISQQSSSLSHKQNEAIDVIATSVHENLFAVQEVAKNCTNAANAAQGAHENTASAQSIVSTSVQSVQNVASTLNTATQSLTQLHDSVKDVTDILSVIDGIAEQTNLLALNAAIEAARAGEQGRGFAVVADEVRNLAKRSQQATEEIQQKLSVLQRFTSQVSDDINSSSDDTNMAVERSAQVSESLHEIESLVTNINEMNQSIATAAEEQEQVSQDIAQRVESIRQDAQESSELNTQVAHSSDELNGIAAKLTSEVNRFNL
ncbi:methyl-accepting chemotaxis protein [Pseudoalteromonas pernae]|uniref:methyl-accepting chemotaxis protein n=1 Tax=Pseudoalteromonas pernae TaxID=3118054 RepID=UPI0032425883